MKAARAARTAVAASLALLAGIAGGRYLLPSPAFDEQATAADKLEPAAGEIEPAVEPFRVVTNRDYRVCGDLGEQFHLRVRPDGWLLGTEWSRSLKELTAAVRQTKDRNPWVFISSDRHATYEILYDVIGAVRDAGVTCVVLWDGVQNAQRQSIARQP